MTVRELIKELLEFDLDEAVNIQVRCDAETLAEYDIESGEEIDEYIEIKEFDDNGATVHIVAENIEY